MSGCCTTGASRITDTAKDPVCGRTVEIGAETPRTTHLGRTYFFRTLQCRTAFEADPSPYVAQMAARRFRMWLWGAA